MRDMSASNAENRPTSWVWTVCGLLLLATMLNYMDRQTLSLIVPDLKDKLGLSDSDYGNIEAAFSLAFAFGSLAMGSIADRVSIRWMYPVVLVAWSAAGIATAYAPEIGAFLHGSASHEPDPKAELYWGLLLCRTLLGLFEAGQWPCALITSRRLLASKDRSLGNSILQSGASLGAIATPFVVRAAMIFFPGENNWRWPFLLIGWVGMFWLVPWFLLVRTNDLDPPAAASSELTLRDAGISPRRIVALMFAVVAINITWQFFRAWLPKFLREQHGYSADFTAGFIVAYYIATDVGCLASGFFARLLAAREGMTVHRSRLVAFACCACMTALAVPLAWLPTGPLLLGTLLVIAAGSLGLFPHYYSFTQELSDKHQGKVTGALGCFTWAATAGVQSIIGNRVQADGSYVFPLVLAGAVPLVATAALALLWDERRPSHPSE